MFTRRGVKWGKQAELQALIPRGKSSARQVTRDRILLLVHAGENNATIVHTLQTSVRAIKRIRKVWCSKATVESETAT